MPIYPVYFFTEPNKLLLQSSGDKYGPISPSVFKTTSRFALNDEAKAFAVVSGNVMLFDYYDDNEVKNIN